MVEIIEYLLVFGVTAAVAGFSLVVLGGFVPTIDHTEGQAVVDRIAAAATTASQNGSSSVSLYLSDASISCSAGSVVLTEGGQQYTSDAIGPLCTFSASGLDGACTITFIRTGEGLDLEVSA